MFHDNMIQKVDGITVHITRKNIKNMYLRVKAPNGEVHISAPLYLSDENISDLIKSKKEWIINKQKYILDNNIEAPLKYIDGETHYLWGEKFSLKLVDRKKIKNTQAYNKIIYLPVSKRSKKEKREEKLMEFYKNQVKLALPQVLDKCIKIVGRKPKDVSVRKMKNWGNCKRDGRITLNSMLAKKDPECLEYVVIHELCHLIEFNHSKNFKKLMDEFCPDWQNIKKKL